MLKRATVTSLLAAFATSASFATLLIVSGCTSDTQPAPEPDIGVTPPDQTGQPVDPLPPATIDNGGFVIDTVVLPDGQAFAEYYSPAFIDTVENFIEDGCPNPNLDFENAPERTEKCIDTTLSIAYETALHVRDFINNHPTYSSESNNYSSEFNNGVARGELEICTLRSEIVNGTNYSDLRFEAAAKVRTAVACVLNVDRAESQLGYFVSTQAQNKLIDLINSQVDSANGNFDVDQMTMQHGLY